jgi:predicted nuclease of predicted toxin-antitoxin system
VRFLCDENILGALVRALARRGCDVLWIALASPGSPDHAALALAGAQDRVLTAADKDFGAFATSARRGRAAGIILRRVAPPPTEDVATRLAEVIASRNDWSGHLAVL